MTKRDDAPGIAGSSLARRIGGQGALLVGGFATGQAFAFLRNALIGHWLSPADFGVAATITLTLQLIETLSDIGSDRLIIQSEHGDAPEFMALAHLTWIVRGVLTCAVLYLAAPFVTAALGISHAQWAFEVASLVPLVKGFTHLDMRRHQRTLDNRATVAYEALPQAIGCMAALPALHVLPTYAAVPWIVLTAGLSAVAISHACARRPYRVGFSRPHLEATLRFGWPIWLSALPLVAVYQGDRLLVGALLGMEALAAFSVAAIITMVPGLLAAKAGNALMLPLLSETRAEPDRFVQRYRTMAETTLALAAAYVTGFALAGGAVLPVVFGPHYTGLGALVTVVAIMWSLRMIQAVPGMALMATADTRPLLWAGLIRASALPFAWLAIEAGLGLVGVAAAAVAAEAASLVYVALRSERAAPGLARTLLTRSLLLVPLLAITALSLLVPLPAMGATVALPLAVLASLLVGIATAAACPGLRAWAAEGLRQPPAAHAARA